MTSRTKQKLGGSGLHETKTRFIEGFVSSRKYQTKTRSEDSQRENSPYKALGGTSLELLPKAAASKPKKYSVLAIKESEVDSYYCTSHKYQQLFFKQNGKSRSTRSLRKLPLGGGLNQDLPVKMMPANKTNSAIKFLKVVSLNRRSFKSPNRHATTKMSRHQGRN